MAEPEVSSKERVYSDGNFRHYDGTVGESFWSRETFPDHSHHVPAVMPLPLPWVRAGLV